MAYTRSVLVGVDATSAGGSISGGSTVCSGGGGTLTLSGHTGSVTKWQSDDNSGFSSPSDIVNTSTSYSPSSLTTTTYYRAVVTNGTCSAANSSSATMTVVSDPSASQVTASQTLCQDGTPTDLSLSVSNGTGSVSYQWYSNTSNSNSGGTVISSNGTSATYTPVTSANGTKYYYCEVTKYCVFEVHVSSP